MPSSGVYTHFLRVTLTMQALETEILLSSSYSIPRWSQHLLDAVVTTGGCYTWCCR